MKPLIKYFYISCFLALSVLISCRSILEDENANFSPLKAGNSISPPKTMKGIIAFESEMEARSYYDELENYINNQPDWIDENKALTEFENSIQGYTSLRRICSEKRERILADGIQDFSEDWEFPFFKDPLMRSILNENFSVIVGSTIYYFINDNYQYEIRELNFTKLNNISSILAKAVCPACW